MFQCAFHKARFIYLINKVHTYYIAITKMNRSVKNGPVKYQQRAKLFKK